MGEFASKGVANAGLVTGILGTVALANQLGGGNGGILGNILGNNCNNQAGALMAENAQLKAEKYADSVAAQVYKASRDEKDALGERLLEKYIQPISQEIADMRVREAQTGAAVDCLAKSTSMRFDSVYREIECAKKECGAAIALEGERRINGDNAIMCYVQGTYVPGKLVMPRDAICPEVMQRYNSWAAPTTPAPDTQAVTGSVQSQTN